MNSRLERNVIYSIPLISIIFEILQTFIAAEGMLALRNYLFFLIILILIIKYFKYVVKLNVYLILLMLYLFVLLVVKGAEQSPFNKLLIVFDAKMLFPLGFALTSTYEHLQALNKRLLITNILFVVGIISFSVFGVGTNVYGGNSGFKVGYFIFGHIYIGSFLLIILPIIFADTKNRIYQYGIIVLGALTLIILVLSVRRTSIVIVLIGALVYVYYYRNHIAKIIQYSIAMILLLLLMFPLYKDSLFKQMEARARLFGDNGAVVKLEEETRLAETLAVWEERIQIQDVNKLFFGANLFDSIGNYAGGIHKGRPLHLDLNVMLHGAGIIGMMLLIMFYIKIYYKFIRIKVKLNLSNEKLLLAAFIGLFSSQLFVLLSGGLVIMTFNLISYLYMGSILGLYRSARAGTLKPDNIITKAQANDNGSISPKSKPYIYELYSENK